MATSGIRSILGGGDAADEVSGKAEKSISSQLRFELIQAAASGDLEPFKKNKDMLKGVTIYDYDKRTPLHLAAAENHLDVVKYLIDELQYDPEFKDRNKKTAYDEAKKANHSEIVEYLISRTDINARYQAIDAAFNGDMETLKRLKDNKVDLSLADYDQRTPLHLASAEGHKEVVRFLIEECKVDYKVKDRWGYTALGEARRSGKTEVENLILTLTGML